MFRIGRIPWRIYFVNRRNASNRLGLNEASRKSLISDKLKMYMESTSHEYRTLDKKSKDLNVSNRKVSMNGKLSGYEINEIMKRMSEIRTLNDIHEELTKRHEEMETIRKMYEESDEGMQELMREEMQEIEEKIVSLENEVILTLVPPDEDDSASAVIEIRAGVGGSEAGLFASEILKMYERFAAMRGWKWQIEEEDTDSISGLRSATAFVTGKNVFGDLKYESGVHRVQRVPMTEKSGRLHTSTMTVAILPKKVDVTHSLPSILSFEAFRSGGKGGQHANRTDSAVRLTHIPTGLFVECSDERSQSENKSRAWTRLQLKIQRKMDLEAIVERSSIRKAQIGRAFRSEKIRTYNYPQSRITDHRVGLSLFGMEEMMQGTLLPRFISDLRAYYDTEAIAEYEKSLPTSVYNKEK